MKYRTSSQINVGTRKFLYAALQIFKLAHFDLLGRQFEFEWTVDGFVLNDQTFGHLTPVQHLTWFIKQIERRGLFNVYCSERAWYRIIFIISSWSMLLQSVVGNNKLWSTASESSIKCWSAGAALRAEQGSCEPISELRARSRERERLAHKALAHFWAIWG